MSKLQHPRAVHVFAMMRRAGAAFSILASGVQQATIDGEALVQRAGFQGGWASDGRALAIVDLEQAGGLVILDRDGNELYTHPLHEAVNSFPAVAWRPGS